MTRNKPTLHTECDRIAEGPLQELARQAGVLPLPDPRRSDAAFVRGVREGVGQRRFSVAGGIRPAVAALSLSAASVLFLLLVDVPLSNGPAQEPVDKASAMEMTQALMGEASEADTLASEAIEEATFSDEALIAPAFDFDGLDDSDLLALNDVLDRALEHDPGKAVRFQR